MERTEQIAELMARWQVSWDAGIDIAPEDLCRECQELLPDISERIRARKFVHSVLNLSLDEGAYPLPPWSPGEEPVPEYRLIEWIGGGGQGEVWKATVEPGRAVALKRVGLTHKLAENEERSMKLICGMVHHPHLMDIHRCWKKDRELVIAMELAAGSLDDRLKQHQSQRRAQDPEGIPLAELLRHIRDAADGLDHLHEPIHETATGKHPIHHRDIKPQNLLLVGKRDDLAFARVKVGDFGLSKASRDWLDTHSGPVSAGYEAPECHPPNARYSAASDQYSLAKTYLVLRTGKYPSELPIGQALLSDPGEWGIVEKALARKPEDRFSSCGKFVRQLEAWHHRPSLSRRAAIGATLAAALAVPPLVLFWPRKQPLKIGVASGTRTQISEVIKQHLAITGKLEWPVHVYEPNEKALDAYRRGEIDVMMVDDIWVPELVTAGLLCDLYEIRAFREEFGGGKLEAHFDKPTLDACRYPLVDTRPRLCGLPFLGNVQLLMYNKQLLAEYEQQLPTDLADLERTLQGAKAKANTKKKQPNRALFAIRAENGNHIAEIFWQVLHCRKGRGAFLADDQLTVVVPQDEGQQALNWLVNANREGLMLNTIAAFGTEELKTLMFREDLLMAFGWPGWITAGYKDRFDKEGVRSSKVISMHLMAGQPVLGAWLLAIKNDSERKDEAYVLIRDLCTDPAIQTQLWRGGSFPANKKVDGAAVMRDEPDIQARVGRHEFYTNGITQVREGLKMAKPRPRTPHWSKKGGIEDAIGERFADFLKWTDPPAIERLLGGIEWLTVK